MRNADVIFVVVYLGLSVCCKAENAIMHRRTACVVAGDCVYNEISTLCLVPLRCREHAGGAREGVHALVPAIAPGLLRPLQAHRLERIRSKGRDF